MEDKKNDIGRTLALWGTILQSGFLIGLAGTVIGMVRAFNSMDRVSDADLAAAISLALHSTIVGCIMSAIGAILLLVALFGMKYRAPWFRTALWLVSAFWLLDAPYWTVPGVIVMIYLATHDKEFAQKSSPPPVGPVTEIVQKK